MKRHSALVTLSRDHQHALAVAQRLRRASAASAGQAAAAFSAFWMLEGRRHFQVEEDVLLPAYALRGDAEHPLVVQALVEHVKIRRDALRVGDGADLDLLHALGERLAAHVRLEEHELFPLVEGTLAAAELDALASKLHELDP